MPEIVKVRLKQAGTEVHCNTHGMRVSKGDRCIVKTEKGLDEGTVLTDPIRIPKEKVTSSKRNLLAEATPQNLEKLANVHEEEKRAFALAQKRIEERELKMKLVKVTYQLDMKKATFAFTADGRVDFRDLVKDLAQALKIRVEMRQVGVRDESRMVGGFGPCGLELCCNAFLEDFEPVSIKMAKEQDLSLNPSKISGICGRLMCCLAYEYPAYEELRKTVPRTGRRVTLKSGEEGKVKKYNFIRKTAVIEVTDGKTLEVSIEEIVPKKSQPKDKSELEKETKKGETRD